MAASAVQRLPFRLGVCVSDSPSILLGVTHAQTCLVLKNRLRALREAGFRVTLVSAPGEWLRNTAAEEGVEAVAIPMSRRIAPVGDLAALARLWWVLGKRRPDMVEFSTPKAGLLGLLAAWLRGVPHRVYLLRGLRLETARGLKRRILLAAERLAAACAQVVLCNSESLRARALALGVAPERKLVVLGEGSSHGVDTTWFCPGPGSAREELGIAREAPVIGFVGRLTSDKGVPELLEAFATIRSTSPGARLLLVGWFDESEDALEPALRERIVADTEILCTGFVRDTVAYYRAMDLVALPTWREGFPNAVLEAAATGVPVITTSATGARDSVLNGVTGLLVPPGRPDAIAEAVCALLGDPARRKRMGRAARRWVCEHFQEERVLRLNAAFCAALIGQTAAANRQIPLHSWRTAVRNRF
jgi:glycosyltransferase involved in cell wall biosynthesis